MRTPIIAGNWKMNTTVTEGIQLAKEIEESDLSNEVEIVLIAPYTHIYALKEIIKNKDIKIGAQNMFYEEEGAFTGEISPKILKDLCVDYVIIGHSERRQIFHEDDELLNKKLKAAFENNIIPILCCGETLEEKKKGFAKEKVKSQITNDLKNLSKNNISSMVIAYEPIWAIGTGETASSDDAEEMCRYIRELIANIYDEPTAKSVRIQYGGSVKPDNVKDIMSKENIDGALVGGASLKANSFIQLVNFNKC